MNIQNIEKQDTITFKNVIVFRELIEGDCCSITPDINKGKTINITFIASLYDGIIKNDIEWIVYHTGNIGYYRDSYSLKNDDYLAIALFKDYEYIKTHYCTWDEYEVYNAFINGVMIINEKQI